MKCADCKFWAAKEGGAWDTGVGDCRRLAPQPRLSSGEGGDQAPFAMWPLTLDDQFCGEFVAAKSPSFV